MRKTTPAVAAVTPFKCRRLKLLTEKHPELLAALLESEIYLPDYYP